MRGIPSVAGKRSGAQRMTRHSLRITRVFHGDIGIGNPQIIFLTTNILRPGKVKEIIARAALPHVIVIADNHAGMPVLGDNFGNIGVGRLKRSPTTPGELEITCPGITPGRHARVGAEIGILEDDALLRQRIEVGGLNPVVAVTTDVVAAQSIKQDEDCVHEFSLSIRIFMISAAGR